MVRTSDKKHWERFWRTKPLKDIYPVGGRTVKAIEERMDVKGKRILEVGAGTGRDSRLLAEAGAVVYVLDYAYSALDFISEQNADGKSYMHPICGDAFGMPIADNSMDVVFHQGLLEHFRDPSGIVKENFRVLKPGGLLVADVPQRWHIYTLIKHILISLGLWFAGWETEFSLGQLERYLTQHGFKPVGFYSEWMYPSLAYRMFREALWKIGIHLPLYPFKSPVLWKVRRYFRERLPKMRFFANTGLSVGVLAIKDTNGK